MADKAATVPTHLGLILDGNRRWAVSKGLPKLTGHRKGYENLKTIGRAAIKRGVKFVSAYVFSTENWQRSKREVDYLMRLLLWVAEHEVDELHKDGIRIRFLGSKDRLSPKIIKAIDSAEAKTKANLKGTLALCLNYGGHQEIVDAANQLIHRKIGKQPITVAEFSKHLYAPDIPPVDFLIRTSGEQRISNFMLWRAAYSELYFAKKHWPAFTVRDLDLALQNFASRQRRFGK